MADSGRYIRFDAEERGPNGCRPLVDEARDIASGRPHDTPFTQLRRAAIPFSARRGLRWQRRFVCRAARRSSSSTRPDHNTQEQPG
jgi:hypothetical protein